MTIRMQCAQRGRELISTKRSLSLLRQLLGLFNRPLRQQPGMDQHTVPFPVEQRLLPEPGEEFITIGSLQDLRQCIASAERGHPPSDSEEKQIMITEDRDRGRPQILNVPEDVERIRTSIDEISRKPQTILLRIESNRLREPLQRGVTALHVADCIGRHTCAQTSADGVSSQATWWCKSVRWACCEESEAIGLGQRPPEAKAGQSPSRVCNSLVMTAQAASWA